jgi:hypothetical protein
MNADLMAAVLGIGKIIVPNIAENTAAEGATAVQAFIMSDSMLLTWSPPGASITQPSAGYTFVWDGLLRGASNGVAIMNWRDEKHHSDMIEGWIACDPKVTASELGVFFSDCI